MFDFGISHVSAGSVGIEYHSRSITDFLDSLQVPSSTYSYPTEEESRVAAENQAPRGLENGVLDVEQLVSAIGFVGGVAVEVRPDELSVEWPGAAPWMVAWTHAASAGVVDFDLETTLEITRCRGVCVVTMQADAFAPVTREDLARAMDVQRRKRLARGNGAFAHTRDDDFVDEIKLRILRFLQRQLETSAWARLVRWLELPATAPTDDELLANGPSFAGEVFFDTACLPDEIDAASEVRASTSNGSGGFQ